ncbi:hypothetical protein F2P81_013370 [Scophthalmus maximus]|uniref:Uncharacterized protein n=1 Tax=Scophthalmus maximus TaxID=52904 RepID=A0A6A4T043_SCOMX|nr:hypothetical protein F2P81_013370 [Scophthalmus maximus]
MSRDLHVFELFYEPLMNRTLSDFVALDGTVSFMKSDPSVARHLSGRPLDAVQVVTMDDCRQLDGRKRAAAVFI